MSKTPTGKQGSATKSTGNSHSTSPTQRTPWYAVSINAGEQPCASVQRLLTTRWLSAAAPRFPLPGCDAKQCGCRYRHHADRRAKLRRQFDREGRLVYFTGKDNRTQRGGRRESDT